MDSNSIALYRLEQNHFALREFLEAVQCSTLYYNVRHLQLTGSTIHQDLQDALQKSILVCRLAGINSKEHFKTIYVCDSFTGTIYMDLRMSKTGFSLIMMHLPLNEQTARWLWQMANT